jgi:hypothetical protein
MIERERILQQKEQARAAKLQAREDAKAAKSAEPASPENAERQARREEKDEARAAKLRTREEAQAGKSAGEAGSAGEPWDLHPPAETETGAQTAPGPRAGAKQNRRDEKQARAREKQSAKASARAAKRRRALSRTTRRRWKTVKRGVASAYNVRYRFTYRSSIARVPSRDEIPVLLNARGLTGRGAEIGVRDGRFSAHLLGTWKGNLVSIDPWLPDDPDAYIDRSNVTEEEHERFYLETQARLAPYGERSEIWRMTSIDAAPLIPDGSLDFAYIDARHDYESVLEDLAAWYPKVKPGGILAGHDYADIDFKENVFGVKSAVDEFFEARGIPVHCTDGPSAVELFPSWIVEIPVHSGAQQNGGHRPTAVAEADSK